MPHPIPVLGVPAVIPGKGDLPILSMGLSTVGSEPPIYSALGGPACAGAVGDAKQGDLSFWLSGDGEQLSFLSLAQCHHTEDWQR